MRQLQALVAIAEEGSFSAAANRIFLSQPALSVLVKQLEESLELKLFHRTTRRVELTPAGEELLQTARRVLGELDEGLGQLRDYATCRRGKVTVAALPSLASGLLAEAVSSFRAVHPSIRIVIRDGVADVVIQAVKSGEADFALGFAVPGEKELAGTDLLMDSLIAIAPVGEFEPSRTRISWTELAQHPIVAMASGTSIRRLTDQAFAQLGIDPLPAYEVSFMSTAIALVAQGEGLAVLPSSAVAQGLPAGLARFELDSPKIERRICILERKGRQRSPSAVQMIEHLMRSARGPR
ncbi:LysR family transcriptional regulator [Nitrogeniibacter aestuarii]|uniref:LysR family transcriptional regulator n=1 Tax=Nitrogeniibacter aestuarii TaxID=2815343 RepID=UPI001D1223A6|nr:LysR family transcriptional regulator [Nitrogeniibacter aestuarii]